MFIMLHIKKFLTFQVFLFIGLIGSVFLKSELYEERRSNTKTAYAGSKMQQNGIEGENDWRPPENGFHESLAVASRLPQSLV